MNAAIKFLPPRGMTGTSKGTCNYWARAGERCDRRARWIRTLLYKGKRHRVTSCGEHRYHLADGIFPDSSRLHRRRPAS